MRKSEGVKFRARHGDAGGSGRGDECRNRCVYWDVSGGVDGDLTNVIFPFMYAWRSIVLITYLVTVVITHLYLG